MLKERNPDKEFYYIDGNVKNNGSKKNIENNRSFIKKEINKLIEKNQIPFMKIIAKCKIENSNRLERYYITFFKNKGTRLTNGTSGGDGWPADVPMIGKHKKGNPQLHGLKKIKAVNKLNHNEILYFNGIRNAAKYFKASPINISDCLRKINKSAKGYYWFYENEPIVIPEYEIYKPVKAIHIETGEIKIYQLATKASGFNPSTIYKACKGTAYGNDGHIYKQHRWEFL